MTVKQHYVPSSYLKSFAIDGTKQSIWQFEKFTGVIDPKQRSVKKIAKSSYFHDLDEYSISLPEVIAYGRIFDYSDDAMVDVYHDKQLMEELFEKIETRIASLHKQVFDYFEDDEAKVDPRFKEKYSVFMVLQGLRTDAQRGLAALMNTTEEKAGFDIFLGTMSNKKRHMAWLQDTSLIFKKAKRLCEEYIWQFIKARDDFFITSDNPATDAFFQQALIHFPISPKVCWRLVHQGCVYDEKEYSYRLEEECDLVTWGGRY